MKTNIYVGSDEVVDVLNVHPPSWSSYREFLEKYAAGAHLEVSEGVLQSYFDECEQKHRTGQRCSTFASNYLIWEMTIVAPALSKTSEHGWQLPDTISREVARPIETALTSAHLRKLIDEWLATGWQPDGSEEPKNRSIHRAPNAWAYAHEFLEDNPMTFTPTLGADGFSVDIALPRWDVKGACEFFSAQIQEALRLFVGVLASDWKERLCKCRYTPCGRYFIHPKPRDSYRHGTFCCHQHASHTANRVWTRLFRVRAKEYLIEAAARELLARKIADARWLADADIKGQLAAHLCQVIAARHLQGYRQEVQVQWITRHAFAIEQRRGALLVD
jgi:hypothetical protein